MVLWKMEVWIPSCEFWELVKMLNFAKCVAWAYRMIFHSCYSCSYDYAHADQSNKEGETMKINKPITYHCQGQLIFNDSLRYSYLIKKILLLLTNLKTTSYNQY